MTGKPKTHSEKAAKDAAHTELRDCIEASQTGAVLERVDAFNQKFPGLQGLMTRPVISYAQPCDAIRGQPYSFQLILLQGASTAWGIVEGNLPDGIVLNPSTGLISGTATAGATAQNTFTVRAGSSSGDDFEMLSIAVHDDCFIPTVIVPPFTARGAVNQPGLWQLSATGTGPQTWDIVGGSLVPGLVLNPDNGVVSGAPTEAGTTTITFRATNACGSDQKQFPLVIYA